MMIYNRLFKTIPSLLPRDYRSLDDYLEEMNCEAGNEEVMEEAECDEAYIM